MRRSLRIMLPGSILAILAGCAILPRPSMEAFAPMTLTVADARTPIRVRFAGVSTLSFDDGELAWMLDGFFSRPGPLQTLLGRIAPVPDRIHDGMERLDYPQPYAVVPAHSHYDHAMDAPIVAMEGGALLVGSVSTLNVGRGLGMPEARMREIAPGGTFSFGKWTLTFIPSSHGPSPFGKPDDSTIDAPLVPPRRQGDWHAGAVWTILVEHASGARLLVNASANFPQENWQPGCVDAVFLGVGMLGRQPAAYRERLWNAMVRDTGARRAILIHWDDFTRPLDEPMAALPWPFDDLAATVTHLQILAARDGVDLRMPPACAPFSPLR